MSDVSRERYDAAIRYFADKEGVSIAKMQANVDKASEAAFQELDKQERILEILSSSEQLSEERERLLKELQEECVHTSVVQKESSMGRAPTLRTCVDCGLGELEGGPGIRFDKLASSQALKEVSTTEYEAYSNFEHWKE